MLTKAVSLSFNPTMVRLLPQHDRLQSRRKSRFQSHNGAIAAVMSIAADNNPQLKFQSHNGAIAANFLLAIKRNFDKFQSHNGAIAARGKAEKGF